MTTLQLTIPAQLERQAAIRIKPREVRDWLDNLPYMNSARSARAASEQLRLINRQPVSPAARLAILGDFLHAYHRLSDSLLDSDPNAEALKAVLKRLSQDIGFGYKIVVHQLVNKRGAGLMDFRSLPLALLGAIHTLSLQLMHYFARHQRAPRVLWSECLALYRHARQIGKQGFAAQLPGAGRIDIDGAFKLIAMLRLSDPYHLDIGMIAVLQHYFARHLEQVLLVPADDSQQHTARLSVAPHSGLDLDLTGFIEQMRVDITTLGTHKQARAIGLSADIPAAATLATLQQTLQHWQSPQGRQAERVETHVAMELVAGLESVYRVVNRGRGFDPAMYLSAGQGDSIDLGQQPAQERVADTRTTQVFPCRTVNRSSGGLALHYRGRQKPRPRVGQLIAVRRPDAQAATGWVVAVCRWLVETESGTGFDMGLQYLAKEPRAVVVHNAPASGARPDYYPAIAAQQKRGGNTVRTLITASAVIAVGETLTVLERGNPVALRCVEMLESGPGFERCICEPQ